MVGIIRRDNALIKANCTPAMRKGTGEKRVTESRNVCAFEWAMASYAYPLNVFLLFCNCRLTNCLRLLAATELVVSFLFHCAHFLFLIFSPRSMCCYYHGLWRSVYFARHQYSTKHNYAFIIIKQPHSIQHI